MEHQLAFDHETDTDAVFVCTACGTAIGFNKPGVGEPAAIPLQGGGWGHPDNPDQWVQPCS